MSDAAVMFAKPGALKPADKAALRKVGIVVVEVEDPQSVRFVRAQTELPAGDLLAAAAKAIFNDPNTSARQAFGRAVAEAVLLRHGEGSSQ